MRPPFLLMLSRCEAARALGRFRSVSGKTRPHFVDWAFAFAPLHPHCSPRLRASLKNRLLPRQEKEPKGILRGRME